MAGISLGDLWQKYQEWRGGPSLSDQIGAAFPQPLGAGRPGQTVAQVAPPPTTLTPQQMDLVSGLTSFGGVTSGAGAALDMSTAARMARAKEMGFDTSRPMYHGTKGDITAFDPKWLGEHTGAGGAKEGFFFTSKPTVAETYAEAAPQAEYATAAKRYRALADDVEKQRQAILDDPAFPWTDAAMEKPDALKDQSYSHQVLANQLDMLGTKSANFRHNNDFSLGQLTRYGGMDPADAEKLKGLGAESIIPTYLRTANPYEIQAGGKVWNQLPEPMTDTIRKAKAAGHDSVIFRNLYDAMQSYMGDKGTSDVTVAFDPSQIRSVHAAFDPTKRGSADLLASLLPPGIVVGGGLGALYGQQGQQ